MTLLDFFLFTVQNLFCDDVAFYDNAADITDIGMNSVRMTLSTLLSIFDSISYNQIQSPHNFLIKVSTDPLGNYLVVDVSLNKEKENKN